MDRRRLLMKHPRLPIEYQEVEWIEQNTIGTGNVYQYIDTGVGYADGFKLIADIKFSTYKNMRKLMGFGTNGATYFGSSADDKYEIGADFIIDLPSTERRIIQYLQYNDHNTLIVQDQQISRFQKFVLLHNFRTSLGFYYNCLSTIYSLQIYINDYLVRKMIPCYRKSDGEIGMYDLVGNQFYTNQGTGTFTKGPDVQ